MLVHITADWQNDDLKLMPTFEIEESTIIIDNNDYDDELIKRKSIEYLRIKYKIDPEILGMEFFGWEFFQW